MEKDEFTIGKVLFYIYFYLSIIIGLIITIMNLNVAISLKGEADPNPGVAMYFVIIFPMIVGLIISVIVTIYHYIKYLDTLKKSLIPLFIWIISFIALFI